MHRVSQLMSVTENVGMLYNIGCSMDKYINLRNLLVKDRPQIKFGTSVFHTYVHNWMCQLDYHPHFNKGWGLLDGEGLEFGQWAAQRAFQADHTDVEDHRMKKMANIYEQENVIDLLSFFINQHLALRNWLRNPRVSLASEVEVRELLDLIESRETAFARCLEHRLTFGD
ncbi:uncharacterized protein PGTG_12393 [Puccinia graminis f. sp. tritici CRL 75-36-700-3]|uniref:Uncharacterized protein n=1 Tax=Puccinia graminis f. sp. tritici (strain CRL 75-36-700-3 / race SCCL) TaxID=418459 RepID=E3KQ62_PUCGT|nr:uncharacterized protein PGTG_12393 [Puccinia graminis f. sp. tritici CRL 75-36-700-3]EFP86437.1 hypothetical protein PGTG_12393 [Puccinia graminis f. sp. tritici CRL 75-36-700-3]